MSGAVTLIGLSAVTHDSANWSAFGTANKLTALNDNSDSTGLAGPPGYGGYPNLLGITVAPPTLPAFAALTYARIGLRMNLAPLPASPVGGTCTMRVALTTTDLGAPVTAQVGQQIFIPSPARNFVTNFSPGPDPTNPTVVFTPGQPPPQPVAWKVGDENRLIVWLAETRMDGTQQPYLYGVYVDALYNEAPVATVVPPTTTIHGQFLLTWAYSDPENDPQAAFQVKVFSATQIAGGGFNPSTTPGLYDSGTVASSAHQAVVPAAGIPGTDAGGYSVYVRLQDLAVPGRWGPWASAPITLLSGIAAPSLTATPDAATASVVLAAVSPNNLLPTNEAQVTVGNGGGVWTPKSLVSAVAVTTSSGGDHVDIRATGGGPAIVELPQVVVVAGQAYRGSVQVARPAGSTVRNVSAAIAWYDLFGTLLSTSAAGATVAESGLAEAYVTVTVDATAPPTTYRAAIQVSVAAAAANEHHYLNTAQLAAGTPGSWGPGWGETLQVLIERSADGGVTWSMVRAAPPGPLPGGVAVCRDYEAPFRAGLTYRATVVDPATLATGPTTTIAPVSLSAVSWWLKDPVAPSLNTAIAVDVDRFQSTITEDQTVHLSLCAAAPLVRAGVLRAPVLPDVPVGVADDTTWYRILDLIETQRTLLLQSCLGDLVGEQWYVRLGATTGIEAVAWSVGATGKQVRRVTLSATVVDPVPVA